MTNADPREDVDNFPKGFINQFDYYSQKTT